MSIATHETTIGRHDPEDRSVNPILYVVDAVTRMRVNVDSARFEVSTAVTMTNTVFWDIRTQFILHRDTIRLHYRVQPVNAM
jgi:hypothetical protein